MRTKGKMILDQQDQDNYRQGYFAETRHDFKTEDYSDYKLTGRARKEKNCLGVF